MSKSTKDKAKLKITGHLKVWNEKTGQVYYDDHNDLTGDAQEIISKIIASTDKLSQITAMKASVDLASAAITVVTYPTTNQVSMKATFSEASFNDTLDEFQLRQGPTNVFSTVTGLSITKDDVTQMAVTWVLTINLTI